MTRTLVPIGEIVAGLAARIDGQHSPLGGSIDVHLRPLRVGVWSCWAAAAEAWL